MPVIEMKKNVEKLLTSIKLLLMLCMSWMQVWDQLLDQCSLQLLQKNDEEAHKGLMVGIRRR